MSATVRRSFFVFLTLMVSVFTCSSIAWATGAATTTTLAVTSAGGAVTSVAAGAVVTLTATVVSGSTPVTPGRVNFCDATATYCTDIHILGTAQLTSTGTATMHFVPGIGGHSYKAVFAGTATYGASTASTKTLTVTAPPVHTSLSAIAAAGGAGNYTLTGTVMGIGATTAPSGTVSFLDATESNLLLSKGALVAGTAGAGQWVNSQTPGTGSAPQAIATADFNGDGFPDLATVNLDGNNVTIFLGNTKGTFTQAAGSPIGVNASPSAIVAGDFNGDGIPDLAVATNNGDSTESITILLGKGDGTFNLATGSPIYVPGPTAITVGDFNGDGVADLAVTLYSKSQVAIYLGNGNGSFTQATGSPITVGATPNAVAAGDFNGDGKIDLAVANTGGNTVTILLGNGNGTFTQATGSPITVGTGPSSIAVGDFNGDGKADLAIADGGDPGFGDPGDGTVTILIGAGNGTFTAATGSPITGLGATDLVFGDFNGDGKVDLAVTLAADQVLTLLGNGNGTFTPAASGPVTVGALPISMAVADMNADGYADLAVVNANDSTVSVLLAANGGIATANVTGVSPTGLGAHNVDASYSGDSIYSTSTSASTGLAASQLTPEITWADPASITYGTALSGTQLNATASVAGTFVYSPPAGTVLAVGIHTLSVTFNPTDSTDYTTATASVILAVDSGNASTTTLAITAGSSTVTTVSAGTMVSLTATVKAAGTPVPQGRVNFCDATAAHCTDIHLFGTAQLTSAGTATLHLIPGVGSHSYQAVFASNPTAGGSTSAAAALTVTGKHASHTVIAGNFASGSYTLTATVTGADSAAAPTGTVSFTDLSDSNAVIGTAALGAGTAGLVFINSQTPATPYDSDSAVMGDFNGDGIPDMAVANQLGNTLTVLLGNGDGTFKAASGSPIVGGNDEQGVVAGDFNGDGKLDLAVVNYGDATVTIWLGNGDGTFKAAAGSPIGLSGRPYNAAVGDFNGDGKADLAICDNEYNQVFILLGNGDGTFTSAAKSPVAVGADPVYAVATDFNGDGKTDLAVANSAAETVGGASTVSILLGNGDGTFTQAAKSPIAVDSGPTELAVADFKGTGVPDLVVSTLFSGNIDILMGNGDGTFTAATGSPVSVGNTPSAVAVGDFNQDGKADLAVPDAAVGKVHILLGNGNGTFTEAANSPFAAGPAGGAILVGDVNGDGSPDFAAVSASGVSVMLSQNQTAVGSATGISPPGSGDQTIAGVYAGDTNFNTSTSATLSLEATPTITWATPAAIIYGTALSATQLNATASVPGTFVYTPALGTVLKAGSQKLSVAFTPTDTAHYTVAAKSVTLTVNQAKSVITWAAPPSITFGTALSAAQLDATANFPGKFVYTPALGTVLPVGTATLSAAFTPTDTVDYTTASASVSITVTAASTSTVTLAITSGGTAVSTVAAGKAVTLTATVTSAAKAVSPGQVSFCDATATYCEDIHLLRTVQLNTSGIASMSFVPAPGSHSYKAVFPGTLGALAGASAASALTVTGATSTTTALASTGSQGDYSLTATVVGGPVPLAATGTISFLDASNGNLVLGTAPTTSGKPGLTFINSQSLYAGNGPTIIALGDFNADGQLDQAVVNTADQTVQILLGVGDGTFNSSTTISFTSGVQPDFVVAGDFNGDGKTDLAVSDSANGAVIILLGNGDGTFTQGTSPAVGANPVFIAEGDYNGDGRADLAVANFGGNSVTVLLGNGDGTFKQAAKSPITVGSAPASVATGDFNGDGIADLAVANSECSGSGEVSGFATCTANGTVTILLGKGDGTFSAATGSPVTVGSGPTMVAVGDFTGTGIADLAVANTSANQSGNTVTILMGKGDGTFTQATGSPVAVEYGVSYIAVADFNQDGKADLAVANACGADSLCMGGSGTVSTLLGNGNGTFTQAAGSPVTLQQALVAVAAGDFNGDGNPDTVTPGPNNVDVLLTEPTQTAIVTGISPVGAGAHNVEASYPGDAAHKASVSPTIALLGVKSTLILPTITWATPAPIAHGAALSATQLDATASVAGTFVYTPASGTVLAVGHNKLSVTFTPTDTTHYLKATAWVDLSVYSGTAPSSTVTTLAVTAAGAAVTTVTSGTVVTLTAKVTKAGTALTSGQVSFCDAAAAFCKDIHLLGTAQLTSAGTATLKFTPGIGSHSYKAVLELGAGFLSSSSAASPLSVTGTYPTTSTIAASGAAGNYTLTATVKGTGGLIAPTGAVSFLDASKSNASLASATLGVGTASLNFSNSSSPATGYSPSNIAIADFNGDGILDQAVSNSIDDTITILLGKGDGTFAQATGSPITVGISPNALAAGDFNGDGKVDLAVANSTDNTVTILLGSGSGTFTQASGSPVFVDIEPWSIVVGDFNGDGKPDFAVTTCASDFSCSSPGGIDIFLGNGNGTFTETAASPVTAGLPPGIIVAADLNGDGNTDLAIANTADGTVTVLLGSGDGNFSEAAGSPVAAGSSPSWIASADFNGDGIPDLAVTNNGSIAILMGAGDGTFTPGFGSPFAVAGSLSSVAVGDFNRDGVPDLAVTALDNYTVAMFLGNGDGTFTQTSRSPITVGSNPEAVVVADFNGDGTSDIAVVNSGVSTISVLLTQLTETATATATSISPVGTGTHNVDASYSGDASYKASVSATTPLTGVGPATPTITWATPAAITYGTALSATQLDATASVAGSFVYTPALATLLKAGTQTLSVTFTPTDTTDYTTATKTVSLVVNKATPAITWATPAAITYAAALSATQLDATASVAGTFVYTPALATVLKAGTQTLSVTFTPTDTTDYLSATRTVSLVVNKATPAITWATPAAITYGTALSATQLDATASVAGTFVYTPTLATVLKAGTETLSVTFTPTDATDYLAATKTVSLIVNKATPAITWATPAAITYGTALSATQLDATTSVAGAFVYTPASATVLKAGTQSLSVTFTPTDTTDYAAVTKTVSQVVNKAAPTITWATPAAITYGTALSATQLDATSPVAGTFVYTPVSGTVLKAGTQTLSVTLTPTDTADYTTAMATVSLVVKQPAPAITWATPAAITYGTALSATQLDATASVAGTFVYTPASGTVLKAGSQTLSVTFTPTDTTDYSTATKSVSIVVNQVSTTVTWGPPTAITYPTPLSATQLDATASVAGSFVYTPASGAVLKVGTQTLSVAFTPTDSTDYKTSSATVTLVVSQAKPTITWATPAAIAYGTALTATQLDATSPAAGTFVYTPASGTVLKVGTQTLSVAFTPTDTADYTSATATVSLVVNKATPAITWATPAAITYGTPLSATQLDATSAVAGALVYTPVSGTELKAGTQTLSVTLTPTDTADYITATKTVSLTVNKATPTITWATPAAITYGTALSATQLDATASKPGTLVYSPASGTILKAGTQTLSVTFTPTDTIDFATVTKSVSLVVKQVTPTVTWAAPAAITYGAALSATQLNATASVAGTFAYTPASGTVLKAGTQALSVKFTPTDSTDYATVTATASLVVKQATPVITWATPAAINTGTALGATQLDATANVPGNFVYTPASGTVLAAGTQTLSVTFTPTDSTDYVTATATVKLTVNATTATATVLAVASGGSAVTTVASGSVITLTASVTASGAAVATGQVNFCDAAATYCTDTHLLGTAQLTSAGTASTRFIPGIGSHSYKAVFTGTLADTSSSSAASALAVTGTYSTTTAIASSGAAGNYTLTATVTGTGGTAAPIGTVSFLDTSNSNASVGSAALGAGTLAIHYTNSQTPTVGNGPSSIARGDFNGDGIADLAVVNSTDGTVTILLGNGAGTFTQASGSPYKVGTFPSSATVGDFNGDGKLDLAVTDNSDNTVTILLGSGSGTFTQAAGSPVKVGSGPTSIASRDFNQDGKADLAVVNTNDGTVTILLGNGAGTFTQASKSPVTVGVYPESIAAGDFNGDGKFDLAVANECGGSTQCSSAGSVSILLSNGDGTFTQASGSPVAVGQNAYSVAVADFNSDGKADLAVVNQAGNSVSILLGSGTGTFTQASGSPITVGYYPYSVAVGDFNGDGKPDLAVLNQCGSDSTCASPGNVMILLGSGTGTFSQSASSPVAVGSSPNFVMVGDFNGDGISDLAAANNGVGSVSVYFTQLSQSAKATATAINPSGTGTHNVEANYPGDTIHKASVSTTTPLL